MFVHILRNVNWQVSPQHHLATVARSSATTSARSGWPSADADRVDVLRRRHADVERERDARYADRVEQFAAEQ